MINLKFNKDNIFIKVALSIWKIIIACVLIFLTYKLFLVKTQGQLILGLFILVFVTLSTIFVVFFKEKFIQKHPKFSKIWKILRIFYFLVIIIFIIISAIGLYRVRERGRTDRTVEFIDSKKITLDDVMGKNLPPEPDKKINDSTIEGIDANGNYIRDDVELAIFKEYPNSAKIRAAELQYAQALQLELTQVFNSETLVAVMKKESYGIDCIGRTGPGSSLNDTSEKIKSDLMIINNRKKEVENIILNTDLRKKIQLDNLNKYMAGYASLPGNECDIEFSSLPN